MPAVTFMHRMIHNSQNCGVRKAVFTSTLWVVTSECAFTGAVQPSGFHPGRGTRTVNTPNIMERKYNVPITRNVLHTPTSGAVRNEGIGLIESADEIIAPPLTPMIAMPVASPGRSGTHLTGVDTG